MNRWKNGQMMRRMTAMIAVVEDSRNDMKVEGFETEILKWNEKVTGLN